MVCEGGGLGSGASAGAESPGGCRGALRGKEPGLRAVCGEQPSTQAARMTEPAGRRGREGTRRVGRGGSLGIETRLLSVSPDGKPGPPEGRGLPG